MKRGKLAIIAGPSAGVGKDTLLKMFLDRHPDWRQPISTTTRGLRAGEKQGEHMNFVSKSTFEKWQKEGKFLETDFHAGHWYGTLLEPVEQLLSNGINVLLRIDVNGALEVKRQRPDTILIFINAENEQALASRMKMRGTETKEQIQSRLELAKREVKLADQFDNIVINATDKQNEAMQDIEAILIKSVS